MKKCDITRDLLPLYADNSCSEDSREFIEQHTAECEACRALHADARKIVQHIRSHQSTQRSFHSFRRRMLTKRVLLIALCVLIPLGILGYFLYDEYQFSQFCLRPVRIEPTVSIVTRLSDGSIHLKLQYTDDDVYINGYSTSRGHLNNPFTDEDIYFEDEDTYYIQLGYSRFYQKDKRNTANNHVGYTFIIATDQSYGKYEFPYGALGGLDRAYKRIVLVGSDGERVLWQEGNEVRAATAEGELELQKKIGNWMIPVETAVP